MTKKAAITAAVTVAAAFWTQACGNERATLPGAGGNTATETGARVGDAAVSTPAAPRGGPSPPSAREAGHSMPLKLEGIGSKAELDRALALLDDADARAQFEAGFRRSFVTDRGRRDYVAATAAMESVLRRVSGFAPAYRVLAYAALNTGFDMVGATSHYEKAVELDPDYGEAHYALSFMLTQFDLERGRTHFKRAMELGVQDERDLGGRFYP